MLPKSIRPEYSTTVPSTGKKIKYQPFSVKEEKILVLAAESQDQDEITNAILNILSSCITSPQDFDVSSLALFDIEYIFLKARSKAVSEKIEMQLTDPNDETYTVGVEINIDKISVSRTEGHTDMIEIDDNITIKMRYPGIKFFSEGLNINDMDSSIKVISSCIDSLIVDKDEVINRADMSDPEIKEWIESLTTGQFRKIIEFFETMPKLSHKITTRNPNTGNDFSITLEGLADFF